MKTPVALRRLEATRKSYQEAKDSLAFKVMAYASQAAVPDEDVLITIGKDLMAMQTNLMEETEKALKSLR